MIDKTILRHGETIAVALSGGKDSVCLLHLLLTVKDELALTIKAVHVNHSIRGSESDRDENFAVELCKKLNVPLKVFKVDAPKFSAENSLSLEQGARLLRYDAFSSIINDGFANVIATAHHKNDNFETMLFNLFRGTGLKGLGGIKQVNDYVIRPIRHLSRQDVENYVVENQLDFVEDSTNLDSLYTRNFIRNELIPKIVERFPEAIDNAEKLSKIAREEDEFLSEQASRLLTEREGKIYLPITAPSVLYNRAVIIAMNNLGITKDYENVHVLQVENLKKLQSGAEVTLPKKVTAVREYDNVVFSSIKTEKTLVELPFAIGKTEIGHKTLVITEEVLDKPYLLFDGDKIPANAVVRTRRDGDVFTKFGGGTKKLKEYLIDKKIPLSERDELLVVASGHTVYLIVGVEISDLIRVTDETKLKLKAKLI